MIEKSGHQTRPPSVLTRLCAVAVSLAAIGVVFTATGYLVSGRHIRNLDPPHVIFILVDDLGWNDVSFHGSPEIPTPNIDALAASGIILNNYYVLPQCTPSRAALLTGKYPVRLGLQHYVLFPSEPRGLPLDVVTLPQHLKNLGYSTHLIGKWHLGYKTKKYLPTRRGFDSFFGFLNGYMDYYDYSHYAEHFTVISSNEEDKKEATVKPRENATEERKEKRKPPVLWGIDLMEDEKVVRNFRGDYATEVFTQKAVDIISKHNVSAPMFLLLSHLAVHVGNQFFPLQAPVEHIERNRHIKDSLRRTYAGIVSALDDSIGKVFEALNEKRMLNNTIIILSSDNGGPVGIDAKDVWHGRASNWPLRGIKFHMWEGGIRVPALVWSPLLKQNQARVSMQMMHITDWLPTIYRATGADVADLGDIDGMSMWESLARKINRSPRTEFLVNIDPVWNMSGLRQGDMKIIIGNHPKSRNGWYKTSGQEDFNIKDLGFTSIDDWVWRNGSIVRDILMKSDLWAISEPDAWRTHAAVICGENFVPENGNCDPVKTPCLYNITRDPCEYQNLAAMFPETVDSMLTRINEYSETSVPPVNAEVLIDPRGDPRCHHFAFEPWMDEDEQFECFV